MADKKIKGITIELSGDAAPLEKALKEVDKASRNTSKELNQINRALKFDPENTTLLKQKFDVLQDAIKNTETKLNALKQAQAEVDRQFQSGEIDAKTYREFQREIEITEGKLKAFKQQAEDTKVKIDSQVDAKPIDKLKQKLEEVSESAKETGEKIKNVGENMSKVSAAIGAAGIGAGMAAAQFDNAAGKIQAALGMTADEAEKLENKAKNVWKAGFGESLEEVADALIRVKQNMHNLDDGEVEKVTQNALLLAKTFDSDVNEVTRAANNLMEGFGLSADEAFDLMTAGAQRGLNFSNELFDNLSEYVPLWSQMGFSAEEMFGVLERGVQSGVYNLDYLNDVMKEFQIRVKDGSKTTSDAFVELSNETQKVWKDFLDGKVTVADVAYAVVGELKSMDDQVLANQIGVGLFGTKWEDLESKAMYAMLGSKEAMEDFEGSMQKASDAMEQTFGQRWESFTRNAATTLEPLGNALLGIAEDWLPKVASALESVANWFANLSPFVQQMIVVFGALVVAIGPALVIIGQIVSALGTLIPLFTSGGAVATAFGAVISALSGPIGIAIAAITALIAIGVALYKNWDEVSVFLTQCWEGIQNVASTVWTAIKDFFTSIWEQIKEIFETVVTAIFEHLKSYWQNMSKGITTVWDGIQQYFSGLWELIKNIFVGALLVILQLLTGQWSEAKKSTEQIWQNIKNAISNMWEGIKKVFSGSLDTIKNFVNTAWNNIKSTISSVISTIVSTVTNKFIEIVNSVRSKMNEVLNTIKSVWGNVKTFFDGINLYDIGKNIIQGLINGIKNMTASAIEAVTGVVNGVVEKAKSLLKIKSPSRVFMEIGEYTNEGFIKGIEKTSKQLQATVNNVYGSLADSANKSQSNQIAYQQIINNSSNIDLSGLIAVITQLVNRPVETSINLDGREIANVVSRHQQNDYNLSARMKGVSFT